MSRKSPGSGVYVVMTRSHHARRPGQRGTGRNQGRIGDYVGEFDEFVGRVEPRLRVALVAAYGPRDGRTATHDALSWAWEHWARVRSMENPVGYLFRVGQSATRRLAVHPIPVDPVGTDADEAQGVSPELVDAVRRLPLQQRTVVVLIHAFGWTQRDVAGVLEINPSTVREHLDRATARLSHDLEVRGVR
jgi:RNA polymerase sigma-70 factor (ECF subfamily)